MEHGCCHVSYYGDSDRHLCSNGNERSRLHSIGEPDGHGQYDPYGSYHAIGTNNILYP